MTGRRWFSRDTFLALTIHGLVFGKKMEISSPLLATKTPPDHDTGAVLDSGNGEALLVVVQPSGPPNFHSLGVYQSKSRLMGEHEVLPLLGGLVEVLFAKLDPLPSHLGRQQGLLGSSPEQQLLVLLQNFLDPQH
jgi:hypothetical protein